MDTLRACAINDVPMVLRKCVDFDMNKTETHEITPYSEIYFAHPHFLFATADGWKRGPARADPFTGKSEPVLKARRAVALKKFRSKTARSKRREMLRSLKKTAELTEAKLPSPFTAVDGRSDIPLGHSKFENHTHAMDINKNEYDDVDMVTHMDVSSVLPMSAARTRPANLSHKKRIGAKKSKKLDYDLPSASREV